MKADCETCALIAKKANMVYEDDNIIAMHNPLPAAGGHLIVVPKEHLPILEMVPDGIVGDMFWVANNLSSKVFETLQVHGTNIIVQNGTAAGQKVPHMQIHIIPRNPEDGLNFEWKPKELSDEEMDTLEVKLQQETSKLGGKKEEAKPVELASPKEVIEEEKDYRVRQLKRTP